MVVPSLPTHDKSSLRMHVTRAGSSTSNGTSAPSSFSLEPMHVRVHIVDDNACRFNESLPSSLESVSSWLNNLFSDSIPSSSSSPPKRSSDRSAKSPRSFEPKCSPLALAIQHISIPAAPSDISRPRRDRPSCNPPAPTYPTPSVSK